MRWNENKNKMLFALIAGTTYTLFGIMQLLAGFGLESSIANAFFIPVDIPGGFVLLVIGAVFLYSWKKLNAGIEEGVAFLYFGILFALLFAIIYLLLMGADALCACLGMEDFEEWKPLDDMKPALYLAILPFIGFFVWRKKFTLGDISKIER